MTLCLCDPYDDCVCLPPTDGDDDSDGDSCVCHDPGDE